MSHSYTPGTTSYFPNPARDEYIRQCHTEHDAANGENAVDARRALLEGRPKPHSWQVLWTEREAVLRRWAWVCDGYIHEYLDRELMEVEKEHFIRESQSIVRVQEWIEKGDMETSSLGDAPNDIRRAQKWLARRQAALDREETRRQRRLLRQGHQTLTAIRRHLHGPVSSRPKASRPARTSPTS